MTVFQAAVDVLFARLGRPATDTPPGGDPIPIRVIPKRPDRIDSFEQTRIVSESNQFEVRAKDIPNPADGGVIILDGDAFIVQGRPRREDPDRLIWTLDAAPELPDGDLVTGADGTGLLTEDDQELLGVP